ncbi:MAG: DHH family phosphoesterase [Flavobacteriaceae bacterium]
MNIPNQKDLLHQLSPGTKVIVIPHRNPDGDALGSCLGLAGVLRKIGCLVDVISPNQGPYFLHWMPGFQDLLIYEEETELCDHLIHSAQVVFTLDFNDLSRTGIMGDQLSKTNAYLAMIDHHESPGSYAQYTYSDTSMSSTCEMVFHFVQEAALGQYIDADIAQCLYTGLVTDTGSFKFSHTTPSTHRVAASLIELGAPNQRIHELIFDQNKPSKLALLGLALHKMEVMPECKTAVLQLSQADLDAHDHQKGDTEGIVNYGLSLEGILLSVIFIEHKHEGLIKISFRSQGDFSVNELARKHFEGGGHRNAAGGKSTESLQKTIERFKSIVRSSPELSKNN